VPVTESANGPTVWLGQKLIILETVGAVGVAVIFMVIEARGLSQFPVVWVT